MPLDGICGVCRRRHPEIQPGGEGTVARPTAKQSYSGDGWPYTPGLTRPSYFAVVRLPAFPTPLHIASAGSRAIHRPTGDNTGKRSGSCWQRYTHLDDFESLLRNHIPTHRCDAPLYRERQTPRIHACSLKALSDRTGLIYAGINSPSPCLQSPGRSLTHGAARLFCLDEEGKSVVSVYTLSAGMAYAPNQSRWGQPRIEVLLRVTRRRLGRVQRTLHTPRSYNRSNKNCNSAGI